MKPEMKRAIRNRCGYGCILCGRPFYQYHHIHGYKEEVGHIEDEITLLCDSCHKKERDGLISKADILDANASPLNIRQAQSTSDRIWYAKTNCTVEIGSNTFHEVGTPDFIPLSLDGIPMVQLTN